MMQRAEQAEEIAPTPAPPRTVLLRTGTVGHPETGERFEDEDE